MIYFLTGKDREKVLNKTKFILEDLPNKDVVQRGEFFELREALHMKDSVDLFGSKKVLIYDNALLLKEKADEVLEIINDLNESENIFIFREEKIPKSFETLLKKMKGVFFDFSKIETKKHTGNTFAIADAVANRDKKKAWALLREAYDNGVASEEITGIILWKIRQLAGFSKTKFEKSELVNLSKNLVYLYHDAHLGLVDFETGLESLVLKKI